MIRQPVWFSIVILMAWFPTLSSLAREQVKEVGPVKVTTSVAPENPTIGDEIVFEVRVDAQANVEVLMPEFGESLERYGIVDFVPSQQISPNGGNTFVQRYTLQPDLSGEQSIPPILVEFIDNRAGQSPTPDDMDAYELLTDRFDFTVKSVVPQDASSDLKPPLGELQPRVETSPAAWAAWIMGGLAVCVLLIAGLFWFRKRQKLRSRRNAYQIARSKLDVLLAKPTPQSAAQVADFFVEISGIIREYLEQRFELRAPDLTTEEFLELAGTAKDLTRDHQLLLRDFLKQADLVKFAGIGATADEIQRSIAVASRFLEETRAQAPVIDEDLLPAASPPGTASTRTVAGYKEQAGV